MNPEKLEGSLAELQPKVEEAARKAGLSFFDTVFYVVDYEDMNQLMSYDGFPKRYHHWMYGMKSILNENQYRYGLAKVFELVLNTDYCNAFLLKNNSHTDNVMVICHVYGHNDFFKNNMWFGNTNRDMIMDMSRHAEWIRGYEERYGEESVEKFLDIAMSIDGLIDPYKDFITSNVESLEERLREEEQEPDSPVLHSTGDPFIDKMLNTSEFVDSEKRRIIAERQRRKVFPRELQSDVLKFLIDNARFSNPEFPNWQRDILKMIREEAYYFVPQRLTKIMNEGWASYWHFQLMAGAGFAGDAGLFDFSRLHSSVVTLRPGVHINPYAVGLNLWRWIEYKWDTGRHGLGYDECKSLDRKIRWDTGDMKGREMIFHVRKYYNDILFVSRFLDQEFCDEHKLFKYGPDGQGNIVVQSKDAKVIRDELIGGLYNCGEPLVYVMNANFENKGALLLFHDFDFNDRMLDLQKSLPVLRNVRHIWGKDVLLETKLPVEKGKSTVYAKSHIRCTEKVYVFTSYDETGKVIKQQEVEIKK